MQHILAISLLLAFAQVSFAQLSGPLSGTLGPGVYTIVGDIGVSAGDSLRLLPGTTFNFLGPYGFGISGTLLAEGTASDSIVFTTDTLANPERYPGLRFTSSGSSGSRLAYCLIENGKAYNGGGVHCREGASLAIEHCIIHDNLASSYGGGVYCFDASPIFMNCLVANNSAAIGGGVHCFSASPFFVNCLISNNSAIDGGGVRGRSNSAATFTHCVISGNSCADGGDGITCDGVAFTVINCIITAVHNEAIHFALDNTGCRFEHNCIVRHGGGVFNSINGAPLGIGQLVTTNANGDSCDIYGNIYLGPFFVDPIAGDFHLSDWSPCIGAGQTGGPNEDYEGNLRPSPPGSLPDIGAYENTLAAPAPYQGLSGSLSGVLGPGIYRVGGSISVNSGATLRILPGTTFLFGGPFSFEIRGTLLAEGTDSDSILFTSDGPVPHPWHGLRFYGVGSSGSQLNYCIFEYAYSDSGAGVYCNRASPDFAHCTFLYNRATLKGGGGCCVSSSSPSFTECAFLDNEAADGGGVYCNESTPSFTECSFTGNTAWGAFPQTYGGGAVSCFAASPTFIQCLFSGDFTEYEGGAVFCRSNPSPSFSNCSFRSNRSEGFGGAVSCWTASPSFVQCSFTGNYGSQGGAIFCSFQSSPILSKCTMDSNSSGGYGGGVCCYESTPILTNCVLHANHGGRGAVYCEDSSPNFTNCTLVGNWASEYGTVYCRDSWPTFNSTIIAFSGGEAIYFQNSAGSQLHHCDFFNNLGGNFTFLNGDSSQGPPDIGRLDTTNANSDSCDTYSNIFLDPMFLSSDDFHLQANSPCIDGGDPSLPIDPDSTIADIGAFYFDQVDVDLPTVPIPMAYALHQNYPNPFNSTTQIRFDIPHATKVELKVYNILGQEVATLGNDIFPAGTHRVSWNATSLPSGFYLCRMETAGFAQIRKMVLVK